jgi:hypothetical protein
VLSGKSKSYRCAIENGTARTTRDVGGGGFARHFANIYGHAALFNSLSIYGTQMFCVPSFIKYKYKYKSVSNHMKSKGKGKGKAVPLQAWTGP